MSFLTGLSNEYVKKVFSSLGIEEEEFIRPLVEKPIYIRVNTLKCSLQRFLRNTELELEMLPYKYGFRVKNEGIKIGKSMEYFLGYLHTQSFSSMLPVLAFKNLSEGSKVIDVAASPGGKTSQIAQHTGNRARITAIDKRFERISLLVSNLERLGVMSVAVERRDSRNLPYKEEFDACLVDAPCSSLGSSLYAISRTTHNRVRDMARVQRKILLAAFDSLKSGGELVYSTCTITEQENEAVLDYLLNERSEARIERVSLPIKHERGIETYSFADAVARVYPWHVESEGFFIARVVKD